jgi:hypothetical protein
MVMCTEFLEAHQAATETPQPARPRRRALRRKTR